MKDVALWKNIAPYKLSENGNTESDARVSQSMS